MKPLIKSLTFCWLIATMVISCQKDKVTPPPNPRSPSPQPQVPTQLNGFIHGNKEYFWDVKWQTTAQGEEIQITTIKLTQEAINRGISVYVARYTEMSEFYWLPTKIDNIELTYKVERNRLNIIANAPFRISNGSDVYIEYK